MQRDDENGTTEERTRGDIIKRIFQRDNFIILVLTGILLFIIALPTKGTDKSTKDGDTASEATKGITGSLFRTESESRTESEKQGESTNVGGNLQGDNFDYAEYLEEKLKKTLSSIGGVGEVEVMITLASSEELVVEKDEPLLRSNTNETDSQGGERIITQLETNETTIYRTEGNNSEPYVVKTILPEVEGVVVVAGGAGDGVVNKNITEVVQALFDVEAHKVKVVKKSD